MDIWSIRLEALLVKEDYLDIVNQDYTLDIDEADLDLLEQRANKATAFIKLSLEDGPLLQLRFITNPYYFVD